MTLYIDTSNNKKIVVRLDDRQLIRIIEAGKTQKLLSLIDRIIKDTGSSINQTSSAGRRVSKIDVNLGPGSFTGLRIGVAVANALGWALKIPINGKKQIVTPVYD